MTVSKLMDVVAANGPLQRILSFHATRDKAWRVLRFRDADDTTGDASACITRRLRFQIVGFLVHD